MNRFGCRLRSDHDTVRPPLVPFFQDLNTFFPRRFHIRTLLDATGLLFRVKEVRLRPADPAGEVGLRHRRDHRRDPLLKLLNERHWWVDDVCHPLGRVGDSDRLQLVINVPAHLRWPKLQRLRRHWPLQPLRDADNAVRNRWPHRGHN